LVEPEASLVVVDAVVDGGVVPAVVSVVAAVVPVAEEPELL